MILGIDVSTFKVHFVELDEQGDRAHASIFDLGKGDLLDRLRRVHYVLPDRDRWEDAMAIGIERPYGKFGTWQTSMVLGAVIQCLPYGTLVEMFDPATWKSKGIGKGHGHDSKAQVQSFVTGLWPECPDQDSADAYCVARTVREVIRT